MCNCSICQKIKINYAVLLDFVMEKFKLFSVLDVGMFKVCLFSLGAIFGALSSKSFKKWAPIAIIIALGSYAYLIYKIFFKKD